MTKAHALPFLHLSSSVCHFDDFSSDKDRKILLIAHVSQNHRRMTWVGGNFKDHLDPTSLPWRELPSTKAGIRSGSP